MDVLAVTVYRGETSVVLLTNAALVGACLALRDAPTCATIAAKT